MPLFAAKTHHSFKMAQNERLDFVASFVAVIIIFYRPVTSVAATQKQNQNETFATVRYGAALAFILLRWPSLDSRRKRVSGKWWRERKSKYTSDTGTPQTHARLVFCSITIDLDRLPNGIASIPLPAEAAHRRVRMRSLWFFPIFNVDYNARNSKSAALNDTLGSKTMIEAAPNETHFSWDVHYHF